MIPECTTKTSIMYAKLVEKAKEGLVASLKLFSTPEGSYMVAYLKKKPDRFFYVTTRRDRKHPRTYIDQARLLEHIKEDFSGVQITMELG
jgi:hypothetical protein